MSSQKGRRAAAGDLLELELKGMKWRFRWCPAGSFMMGSPDSEIKRRRDETQHKVTLTQGFWLGETQVTQEQWQAVTEKNPSHFKGAKLPVDFVHWQNCQDFVQELNALKIAPAGFTFALPTEAQWEYACRAGSTTAYCYGDDARKLGDCAWYGKNSDSKTHPVGQKKPNTWGLYDMHGNVWEWCEDWYKRDYSPGDASSGRYRLSRGGSWNDYAARYFRSAYRHSVMPSPRNHGFGLRVALVSEDK